MASWGDVNVALNRLVRTGAISGFKTNLADPDRSAGLHVVATAPVVVDRSSPDYDEEAVEGIRQTVMNELDRLIEGATVTIERAPTAG